MSFAPLLSVTDLHKSFGALDVLRGIDFSVGRGERVAIIGPSGSGKSTCLRAVNYLEPPNRGTIRLDGTLIGQVERPDGSTRQMSDTEMAPQRTMMGMVFQLFHLWPHLTVRDNVALQPQKVAGLKRSAARALADEMLAKVHMSDKADEYPDRLSGGQQQRVAIARALAQKPKLLLFDEPTSALDPELVGEVLTVIRELAAENRSMLLVTHEIRFAQEMADRVLFMDGGVIVEQGNPNDVLVNPKTPRLQQFLKQVTGSSNGDDAGAR